MVPDDAVIALPKTIGPAVVMFAVDVVVPFVPIVKAVGGILPPTIALNAIVPVVPGLTVNPKAPLIVELNVIARLAAVVAIVDVPVKIKVLVLVVPKVILLALLTVALFKITLLLNVDAVLPAPSVDVPFKVMVPALDA